jgi:hypothetical protein
MPRVLTGRGPQSDKNVSRETLLTDGDRKPYKTAYTPWLTMGKIARKPPFRAGMASTILLLIFARKNHRVFNRRTFKQNFGFMLSLTVGSLILCDPHTISSGNCFSFPIPAVVVSLKTENDWIPFG